METLTALSMLFGAYAIGRFIAVLLLDGIGELWWRWGYYRWLRATWRRAGQQPPSWWKLIRGRS